VNASEIEQLYEFTYFTIDENTRGITREQSLVAPSPGGNCLNWVLGHIVATRVPVLALAGAEPVWTAADAAIYRRGAAPLDAERITPEALAAPGSPAVPGGLQPVGMQLGILNFHEAYHAGQLGILRRLLGLPGVIR